MKKRDEEYLYPRSWVIVGPGDFVEVVSVKRDNLDRVYIQPPVLGRTGFGRLAVKWKYPQLLRKVRLAEAE